MMTAKWFSGGVEIVVSTDWDGTETAAQQAARLHVKVLAKLITHPIDR